MARDRGFRRHQMDRMKKRVANYYGGYAKGDPRIIGKLAQTRTPCSCYVCGNPRRKLGERTLAERCQYADVAEEAIAPA